MNKRSIVISLLFLWCVPALLATGETQIPQPQQNAARVEDLDDLVNASSFKLGVGKKTLRVVEEGVGKSLKEVCQLRQTINELPQKLHSVGLDLIQKSIMGLGFLICLATACYNLSPGHQSAAETTKSEKKIATNNLPGAIIGGVLALCCGYLLMH